MDLKTFIRDVPDFPKQGILFRDITPLLGNAEAFACAIEEMARRYEGGGFDKIVAVESRGFILGAALALRLKCGFVPVRKPGKLPSDTVRQTYDLEYGQDSLEMHKDALKPGEKVLVVDDVLATGGTLAATAKLVETVGGAVFEIVTLVELTFLEGRKKIAGYSYHSTLRY